MGTRNLTMVYMDNEYKIAQYGQFDGYPEGAGCLILNFLRGVKLDYFKEKVKNIQEFTKEELARIDTYIKMNVMPEWKSMYPTLDRDLGCKILSEITFNGQKRIEKDLKFAADSLYCEWAYVIDLDKNTFEVYKGFNKEKLTEEDRFYFLMKEDAEYYPVKLVKTYDLNNLPSEEEFLKDFEED